MSENFKEIFRYENKSNDYTELGKYNNEIFNIPKLAQNRNVIIPGQVKYWNNLEYREKERLPERVIYEEDPDFETIKQ